MVHWVILLKSVAVRWQEVCRTYCFCFLLALFGMYTSSYYWLKAKIQMCLIKLYLNFCLVYKVDIYSQEEESGNNDYV